MAAEAVIRYAAEGGAAALGRPAPSLRTVRDDVVFQGWPGGPPPREILMSLNAQHQPSVLDCPGVKRTASKSGLKIAPNGGEAKPKGVYTAYASLPALSSDGATAASVLNTDMGGRGATQVVTLSKQAGKWVVSGHLVVAFS